MTSLTRFFAIALFALTVAIAPVRAEEAAKSNASIAVVDIQSLLKNSKAAQGIESQVATLRKSFQAEIEKEEKALRAAEKEIIDQKSKLKEDEFKAKAQEFQKKVGASQKKIQERKGKLDKALGTAVGKLRGEIVKIVAEIGEKQNLDLVLARTDVVIVSKEMDITAQVLERINADLPSVSLSVE